MQRPIIELQRPVVREPRLVVALPRQVVRMPRLMVGQSRLVARLPRPIIGQTRPVVRLQCPVMKTRRAAVGMMRVVGTLRVVMMSPRLARHLCCRFPLVRRKPYERWRKRIRSVSPMTRTRLQAR